MDINKTSYLTDLNPSVFLTTGGLKPVPAVTGRQHMTGVKKRQTTMFTHTKIPINYVIGLGKKNTVPSGKPHSYKEIMQTPSCSQLNLEPSCCEVTALTTTHQCTKSNEIN